MTLKRYISAFFRALAMTLLGEKPPETRYPAIQQWATATIALIDRIIDQADATGLNQAGRQRVTLTIDRRQIDLDKALQIIRQHAASDYPYLLKHLNQYSLMTIQATNINDQYLAQRLVELQGVSPEVSDLLNCLSDHLHAFPTVEVPMAT